MELLQKKNMEQITTEVLQSLISSKESSQNVPNPEGRPSKYTDKVIQSLVKSFEDGSTITEACNIAGISRQSFYDWLEIYPEFSDKMTIAQEYPDYVARSLLTSAMKKGDVDTAKWWAERRMKGEFSTRNEITGKDGERLTNLIQVNESNKPIALADNSQKE